MHRLSEQSNVILDHQNRAFAAKDIKKGELVEVAPAIIIPDKGRRSAFAMEGKGLLPAIYSWDDGNDTIAVALGYMALYGYSMTPNVEVTSLIDKRFLQGVALRDISAGEHLTREQEFKNQVDETERLDKIDVSNVSSFKLKVGQGKFGNGVFATKPILKGETVEVCPIIRVAPRDYRRSKNMLLHHYFFEWDDETPGETKTPSKTPSALSLGYGGVYNHSSTGDQLKFRTDFKKRTITFYSEVDVEPGEELFHNYGWDDRDVRFE